MASFYGFRISVDDDGVWLTEQATGELCGPYESRAAAIADRRDEGPVHGPWLPVWRAVELDRTAAFPHQRECGQRCGRPAAVYAIDPLPGGWGGRYCEPCARALKFTITDRL